MALAIRLLHKSFINHEKYFTDRFGGPEFLPRMKGVLITSVRRGPAKLVQAAEVGL